MPDQRANLGQFNFDDAPGGDADLNAIFGNPEITPPVQVPATTAQTQESAPFLRNATGSVVYNSAEDAIKGIEHKDALLEEARRKLQELTGEDAFKKRNQQQHEQHQEVNYGLDAKKYMADLNAAVNTGKEEDVVLVQQKFIMDSLAGYTPMLTEVARSQAIGRVTSEVPDFTKFMGSEDYNKTLDAFPLLRNSIQIAETNPSAAGELSQLYRMAYDTSTGRNMSRIVQEQSQQQQQHVAAPVRPTVSSTPMTPSVQTYTPAKTSLQRNRNIVEQFESSGIEDRRF